MTVPSRYDVVVVGSGIAGLYAASLAAAHRSVLLVTKGALEESNTRYAQGGIAVALADGDSPELHLRDTIAAGDGLCSPHAVAVLTGEAPSCIRDLLSLGVPFDRHGGDLAWTLEAAHTRPRILHAGGDATGASIETALAAAVRGLMQHRVGRGIDVREGALCTALHLDGGRVDGIELLREDGTGESVRASHVLLATGGAGQLFSRTTNPSVATGDGIALAYRAGAHLMDIEFMQFHPTALALDGAPSFLISEAVRGEGGILRDRTGHAFMAGYHPDRELAPRDVVARAIHRQMERTGSDRVWLDVTHLDPSLIEQRFPSILRFCRQWGIDPVREPIPVSPAAHYLMGGVRTDTWGRTSLPGLLACGEVACTGVHGANRLASNSLLEGLVFARRAVRSLLGADGAEDAMLPAPDSPMPIGTVPTGVSYDAPSRQALASAMWRDASLVRSESSLRRVQSLLDAAPAAEPDPAVPLKEQYEADNLALLARLLLASALYREESRGGHFREDFPHRKTAWQRHTVISPAGIGTVPLGAGAREAVAAHD